MTSILIESTLSRGGGLEGRMLVFSRGMFNCLAPRVARMRSSWDRINRLPLIASNAETYKLTLEASFRVANNAQFARPLMKLTQVRKLHLSYECWVNFCDFVNEVIGQKLQQFAPSLEYLHVSFCREPIASSLAPFIAHLHNVRELTLPHLATPALCKAIAAGPGATLRALKIDDSQCEPSQCEPADLDALVAGCPEILRLELRGQRSRTSLLPSVSKLRYLQTLVVNDCSMFLGSELSLATMQQCWGNLCCLTYLDIVDWSCRFKFNNDMAIALATTVGPQLTVLRLSLSQYSSDAFAAICCASSFPNVDDFAFLGQRAIDDVSVSLSPSITHLKLHGLTLAPRTLTQLLKNKPNLLHLNLSLSKLCQPSRSVDDQEEQNDNDWFGQLIKCPLKSLELKGFMLGVCMDERVGQLAATLAAVSIEVRNQHTETWRFLSALCSECVLLESIYVKVCERSVVIDTTVAFAGLRNNERLQSLTVSGYDYSQVPVCHSPIFDELMSMRSTQLRSINIHGFFSFKQCSKLAQRFAGLEAVAWVRAADPKTLRSLFPRVRWG